MKPNSIKHIYNVFDPDNVGYFNEEGFIQNLFNFNQAIGEQIDEQSLKRFD